MSKSRTQEVKTRDTRRTRQKVCLTPYTVAYSILFTELNVHSPVSLEIDVEITEGTGHWRMFPEGMDFRFPRDISPNSSSP